MRLLFSLIADSCSALCTSLRQWGAWAEGDRRHPLLHSRFGCGLINTIVYDSISVLRYPWLRRYAGNTKTIYPPFQSMVGRPLKSGLQISPYLSLYRTTTAVKLIPDKSHDVDD